MCLVCLSQVGETAAMLTLLGFVCYVLCLLGHSYLVLGDDHSFMGGNDDTWSGEFVGMYGTNIMFVLVNYKLVSTRW